MPNDSMPSAEISGGNFVRPPKPLQIAGNNVSTSWKDWLQQYKWFATAAQLDKKSPEIQVATLMSSIGADAVNIYNSFSLGMEQQRNVSIIQAKFDEYFSPKISVTFERYTFNTLHQVEGENFDNFFTKIKNQAKKCSFGKLEDSLLADKVVVGIKSDAIREKLLSEDDLNLEKAIKICRASEMATQQLHELHKKDEHKIDVIKKFKGKQLQNNNASGDTATYQCKRCGNIHAFRKCRAYNYKCQNCKRKGHLTHLCFRESRNRTNKRVDTLQHDRNDSSSECTDGECSDFLVLSLNKSPTNKDVDNNWYEEIRSTTTK